MYNCYSFFFFALTAHHVSLSQTERKTKSTHQDVEEIRSSYRKVRMQCGNSMRDDWCITYSQPRSQDFSSGSSKTKKRILAGKRIVAGQRARKGQWPWQILLLKKYRPKCGASILAPYWVVTAAHCVFDRNTQKTILPSFLTVRAGEYDTKVIEDTEQEFGITEIISHPDFVLQTYHNDVALLKLAKPIKFNRFVRPIGLPKSRAKVGDQCFATGWGRITSVVGCMHNILQQAKTPIVDTQHFIQMTSQSMVGEHSLCSGVGHGRASASPGDSGGPFACLSGNSWYLQGVVSWGTCNEYTIHTNIFYFKNWIIKQIETYKY